MQPTCRATGCTEPVTTVIITNRYPMLHLPLCGLHIQELTACLNDGPISNDELLRRGLADATNVVMSLVWGGEDN